MTRVEGRGYRVEGEGTIRVEGDLPSTRDIRGEGGLPSTLSPQPSTLYVPSTLNPQPYVELHCHTNYSLLDGAAHPEDMVARAREWGMEALAITDHDGLCGAVRFSTAAREAGIKPIIGAEVTLEGDFHLVLLAKNREGYSNLSRLISHAQLRHAKNQARLDLATLAQHTSGLIALSACDKGEIASSLLAGDGRKARQGVERYREIFGDDFWIELQYHYLPLDERLIAGLVELADRLGIGCVATNDAHYAKREGHRLQDILVCIKHRTTLDNSQHLRRPNSEYYLKSSAEMASLFRRYPGAIANTAIVAAKCSVDLNFAGHRLPSFVVPEGETAFSYLYKLCQAGAEERYQPITPPVSKQLAHELDVIYHTNLAEYFLLVWDIMRYAKEQRIPGQGRGSAADSIVAYVLGITKVDPIRHNLLFERFLNEERVGMPDIDVDFSARHREQILRYVYDKYGEEYTAMVCNVVTFRARSAIRDVGKALGLPLDFLDRLAKDRVEGIGYRVEGIEHRVEGEGLRVEGGDPSTLYPLPSTLSSPSTLNPLPSTLSEMCEAIDGFPRHLSIHVGGMIITGTPLVEIVPLERATMPGRVVVQWDKDSVEDAGLIKMDLLSLGMLALIHEALELIEQRGVRLDLDRIPLDDPAV
ncbi:MAG: DNA polymerase III subunit alpha, partial [Chloroflexi bacterium]|nr:DNA polymerase III subunit alpha [Chloroflexota bacterium]